MVSTSASSRCRRHEPFTVAGLDESFLVYEGTVHGTLPFVLTQNLGPTTLRFRLRYQSCTETAVLATYDHLSRDSSRWPGSHSWLIGGRTRRQT